MVICNTVTQYIALVILPKSMNRRQSLVLLQRLESTILSLPHSSGIRQYNTRQKKKIRESLVCDQFNRQGNKKWNLGKIFQKYRPNTIQASDRGNFTESRE